MGSLGAVLGPGCLLTLASNDFFTSSAANTIAPHCGEITLPKVIKDKTKIQKSHSVSDTGVQLSDRVFKSCIFARFCFFFSILVLLTYSWLTMLCQFLPYTKVIQLHIDIHSFFKYSFPLWFFIGYRT